AARDFPERGTSGLELEWNVMGADLRPALHWPGVQSQVTFSDALREAYLPEWLARYSQLEVFNWMIEWATDPFYSPPLAVYQARLFEACLLSTLERAATGGAGSLHAWHGNLLYPVEVGYQSIPRGWNLAKRRYLERCVDLFGSRLATAGIHANLSLPEPLLAWDLVHLPRSRRQPSQLDAYRNEVYAHATRLLRAHAALFIATSASTPLRAEVREGQAIVVLTDHDSVRTLTFPSPPELDPAYLYRTHADYVRLSKDLVRRGIRFGNNNWTPVRARSLAEPVERLIAISAEELEALGQRGLYKENGRDAPSREHVAREIIVHNLLARIDLPMARVEVRTDEGGLPLDLEIANLALKELLLLRGYADAEFGGLFHYGRDDLRRTRGNELAAAINGMDAQLVHPFSRVRVGMRAFLGETLDNVRPLAHALGWDEWLAPLDELARGAPNAAERIRTRLLPDADEHSVVDAEAISRLFEERRAQVAGDIELIRRELAGLGPMAGKLEALWQRAEAAHLLPTAEARPTAIQMDPTADDVTREIVLLASRLIAIPSVSVAPGGSPRLEAIHAAVQFAAEELRRGGLDVRVFAEGRFPALLAAFPGESPAPVVLLGHLDVVGPDPDDTQFRPRLEGDYLVGRGAADMKTVAATFVVWMKAARRAGPPYPPLRLLLVGNEEPGETEPTGTPHILQALAREGRPVPALMIAGERTGERGNELVGEVCLENRGLLRAELRARGTRAHSAVQPSFDVMMRLVEARARLLEAARRHLQLEAPTSWRSQIAFPYLVSGERGVFNLTADRAALGVEVRSLPDDSLRGLVDLLRSLAHAEGLELELLACEEGVRCDPANPFAQHLLQAVRETSGREPVLGRKLHATSARFAPNSQGIVWGQSGLAPHAAGERHYLPSILPYFRALTRFGELAAAARVPESVIIHRT
ncbi:MAG: M20/M25/M40 family metallo-hydrolase, partial [Chloroflexi bacterium]|nr:M20/M25/M40 family metallo-hydrolase [Chloroflexota bacterium]